MATKLKQGPPPSLSSLSAVNSKQKIFFNTVSSPLVKISATKFKNNKLRSLEKWNGGGNLKYNDNDYYRAIFVGAVRDEK